MSRVELGTKWVCVGCAERFYDLRRVPPICPKCATAQPPPAPRVVRPGRRPSEPMRAVPRVPVEVADVEEVDAEDDDGQAVILDPDDGDEDAIVEEIGVEAPSRLE